MLWSCRSRAVQKCALHSPAAQAERCLVPSGGKHAGVIAVTFTSGHAGNHEGLCQWVGELSVPTGSTTHTVPWSCPGEGAGDEPSLAWCDSFMSWSKQMKWIVTSKISPLFLGQGSYSLSKTSSQLMQAFKCSPSFSYPVLETTLGICKRSQIFISLWQGVFYFKEQGGLCAWKICSATTYTSQFWGSYVLCKVTGQVGMDYSTAALFLWKQMVLTHGQHCWICWQWFYTKCCFASPSDFGITYHWTWASILHGSLIYVGKQFWCSSTAFDEYLTPLDLWLLPALKKYPSSLFCFISSNSSNRMLWIWF